MAQAQAPAHNLNSKEPIKNKIPLQILIYNGLFYVSEYYPIGGIKACTSGNAPSNFLISTNADCAAGP